MAGEPWEQAACVLVLGEEFVEVVLHLAVLALHILSDRGLMQPLVRAWVLGVHIDLVVLKYDPLWRVFIKDQIEGNLFTFSRREERMLLHLLPR